MLLAAWDFHVYTFGDHETEIRALLRRIRPKFGKVGARDFEAQTCQPVAGALRRSLVSVRSLRRP